jgi:hypothetical protein
MRRIGQCACGAEIVSGLRGPVPTLCAKCRAKRDRSAYQAAYFQRRRKADPGWAAQRAATRRAWAAKQKEQQP